MEKLKKGMALLLALMCVTVLFTGCGNKVEEDDDEDEAEEYVIDFCGQEDSFEGAKDSYAEGEKVSLTFGYIATDTDYSFYVDEEPFNADYDSKKDVYKIKFKMPDHDVKVRYESRNTMENDPEAYTGGPGADGADVKPIKLYKKYKYIYDENIDYTKNYYYSAQVDYPAVDEEYPELRDTLDKRITALNDEYTDGLAQMTEDAAYAYKNEGTTEYRNYYKNTRTSICRADETVLSYVEYHETNMGPGMTYTTVTGRNLDTATGTELTLLDVVTDMKALKEAVLDTVSEIDYDPVYEGIFESTMDKIIKEKSYVSDDYFSWNICYEGLWLHFPADQPYDVQGAVNSRNTMFIPFEGHEDLFDERYMVIPDSYCYDLEMMNGREDTYWIDLDGDSEYDEVTISAVPDEYEGDWIYEVSVVTEGGLREQTLKDGISYWECKGVVCHVPDGTNYLYITGSMENDYEATAIYKLGNSFRYVDEFGGAIRQIYGGEDGDDILWETMNDPAHFFLAERDFKMGTFDQRAYHEVGSDGRPSIIDPYWNYAETEYFSITTKMDMKVMKVDEDGNELGLETLKRNTGVIPYRTDDESFIDIKDEDGNIWRLSLTKGEYEEWLIEEQEASELFDGLLYAG